MKLGIYAGEFPSTTFINALVRGLAERGVEVHLFGKRKEDLKLFSRLPIRDLTCGKSRLSTFFLGLGEKARRPNWAKDQSLSLASYARFGPMVRFPTAIFHVQWTKHLVELAPLLAHIPGKIILSLRGTQTNVSPWTQPEFHKALLNCLPLVSHFHAVSENMKEVALELGVPAEKVTVIHPAVADDLIQSPMPPKKEKNLFISVARDHWKKGLMYALDAFGQLRAQNSAPWRYEIIGPGRFEAEKFQAIDLGIAENVIFCGALAHSKVLEKIKKADCLILPSVEEGLANVVLEAMAVGTRVISSDCNGMPEAISHAQEGWLFPSRNAQELFKWLQVAMHQSPEESLAMCQAGREKIRSKFLASNQINRFIQLYQGL